MSARQMVFLSSQGNKIIQKPPIEQFCTILSNIFKQVVGRQTQLLMETSQKVHWRNGFGKAKNIVP